MNSYNGFSPETRNRAQNWLRKQWQSGALDKPARCCACGQDQGIIHAHAEDYSEPFRAGVTDEYHLCFVCHMMVHCRFKNRRAWKRYCDAVARGLRSAPTYANNFYAFKAAFLDKNPELQMTVQGEIPKRLALQELPFDQIRDRPKTLDLAVAAGE